MDFHGIFKSYSIIQRENPRRTRFVAEVLQLRTNYIWETYGYGGPSARQDHLRVNVLKPTDTMECFNLLRSRFEERPEFVAKAADYHDQVRRGAENNFSRVSRQWYESFLRQTYGGQLWGKILLSAGTVHVGKFHWD